MFIAIIKLWLKKGDTKIGTCKECKSKNVNVTYYRTLRFLGSLLNRGWYCNDCFAVMDFGVNDNL